MCKLKSNTKSTKILSIEDMLTMLPFGKTKLYQLIRSEAIPVVKIGRSYITTEELLNSWISDNIGKTIYY